MISNGLARRCLAALAAGLTLLGFSAADAAAQRQDLVVQSTTSVRDAGLLDQLIAPQFEQRFPEWDLKFVAVGTGQAMTNARAGQGDALIGHSPALEQQFVQDGFSYEPFGRTVMWNDYVIVGPASDPAGVLTAARARALIVHDGLERGDRPVIRELLKRPAVGDRVAATTAERALLGEP